MKRLPIGRMNSQEGASKSAPQRWAHASDWVRLACAGLLWTLASLALAQSEAPGTPLQPAKFSAMPPGPVGPSWTFVGLPHQTKPKTLFEIVNDPGAGAVLRIDADRSYGNLASFGSGIAKPASTLTWTWKLVKANPRADLTERSGDDTPIKVCVMFDYDLSVLSFGERAEMHIVRSESDQPVPIATVCYVWDHTLPVGRILPSPFTSRLTYFVVESGEEHLGQWQHVQRGVLADFQKAYGTEFAKLGGDGPPKIIGILVGADADNTATASAAEVGDISFSP